MMTDDQRSKVAALKAAIGATATTWEGTPSGVRAAVVALKEELRRDGVTARELAASVGVHESTLCRWERETVTRRALVPVMAKKARGRSAGFRRVHVADAAVTSTSAPFSSSMQAPITSARGLRVAHAPSGLVVDGLDIETLVVLLRRMS